MRPTSRGRAAPPPAVAARDLLRASDRALTTSGNHAASARIQTRPKVLTFAARTALDRARSAAFGLPAQCARTTGMARVQVPITEGFLVPASQPPARQAGRQAGRGR